MTWCQSAAGRSVGTLWFVVAYTMPGVGEGGVLVWTRSKVTLIRIRGMAARSLLLQKALLSSRM
jgi:hypothetical protein